MSISAGRSPLPALTSLRFFAAAEVVLYHEVYTTGTLTGTNVFLRDLASAGYEAVTFFFVLSGFILVYAYSERSEQGGLSASAGQFWVARVARIWPAYLLGLLLALPHFAYGALISKITTVPDFLLGLVLVPILQQAWWPRAAMAWNPPAWSLSVELFFYMCFPALALASARVPRRVFLFLAYGFVLGVAALRYVVTSADIPFGSAAWNFYMFFPLFHLPQFIFGMGLGRLYLFGPPVSGRAHNGMFAAGAFGLLIVFGGSSLLPAWSHTDATLVLLFGLVIYGGARAHGALRMLASPVLILLGEASYSIYIVHMPLGWWWGLLTRRSTLPALTNFVAYFALVIAVSIMSYLYVEKPMRRWILGRRPNGRLRAVRSVRL